MFNQSYNKKIAQRCLIVFIYLALPLQTWATEKHCHKANIAVQVLGSGGPELSAERASSSYLLWHNNKAIVMLDAGAGTSMRFAQSQAKWSDLEIVLFSHLHADHSNDLPALIKASWFGEKRKNLPIFGPFGNHLMPSTTEWLTQLFDQNDGAYRYLSDFYQEQSHSNYLLKPKNLKNITENQIIYDNGVLQIIAQQVDHGPIPAFAYLIKVCGKTIVFSGDTNGQGLNAFDSQQTDLFIAHNAIAESAGRVAQSLHMKPSQIGLFAEQLNTKKLVLSHRMRRSLGAETSTTQFIRENYKGPITYADDLDVFKLD